MTKPTTRGIVARIATVTTLGLCSAATLDSAAADAATQHSTPQNSTGAHPPSKPDSPENPLLRAWLLETLYLDLSGARSLYQAARRGAPGTMASTLATARLLDLARDEGAGDALHTSLPAEVVAKLSPNQPRGRTSQTAREVAAARSKTDPAQRAEQLRSARLATVERERAEPSWRSAFAQAYANLIPEHSRRTSPDVGRSRDWLELVELALASRFAEAEQFAWLRLGIRTRRLEVDAVEFVERKLRRLASVRPRGPHEDTALASIRKLVAEHLDRNNVQSAAELLRHVPAPPRGDDR